MCSAGLFSACDSFSLKGDKENFFFICGVCSCSCFYTQATVSSVVSHFLSVLSHGSLQIRETDMKLSFHTLQTALSRSGLNLKDG